MQSNAFQSVPRSLCAASMLFILATFCLASASNAAENGIERRPSNPGTVVYLISPAAGETVSSPVTLQFGLKGMGVAPAGVMKPGTGHHHLLIDTELPDMSLPIPADETHRHYGGGQTETELELTPGKHTLQLLLGDERHVPHDPPVFSEKIEITIVE